MTEREPRFEIECGDCCMTINAADPKAAFEIFMTGKSEADLAPLARFREVPWNAQFIWDKKGGRKRRGKWYFVEPSWLARTDGELVEKTSTKEG